MFFSFVIVFNVFDISVVYVKETSLHKTSSVQPVVEKKNQKFRLKVHH